MGSQDQHWSRAAEDYEKEFVDPYRPDVRSPLSDALRALAGGEKTAADLGCGIGPLLSPLAGLFGQVYAVDFAEGMLRRARERCRNVKNVAFLQRGLTDLAPLHGKLDVAVAVNSLVSPDIGDLQKILGEVRLCLRPGGTFLGVVPAMDGVHYYTMLLVDRALAAGKPIGAARKNAAYLAEHECYDFAFGQFRYRGLEQHFWQPFEVRHRLKRAGFRRVRLARVWLSWQQFACADDLKGQRPPWDWFFRAEVKKEK
jgi:SAM-dependent methyltransferase